MNKLIKIFLIIYLCIIGYMIIYNFLNNQEILTYGFGQVGIGVVCVIVVYLLVLILKNIYNNISFNESIVLLCTILIWGYPIFFSKSTMLGLVGATYLAIFFVAGLLSFWFLKRSERRKKILLITLFFELYLISIYGYRFLIERDIILFCCLYLVLIYLFIFGINGNVKTIIRKLLIVMTILISVGIVAIIGFYVYIQFIFFNPFALTPAQYYEKYHDECLVLEQKIIEGTFTKEDKLNDKYMREIEIDGNIYYSIVIDGFLENSHELVYSPGGSEPPSELCGGEFMEGRGLIEGNRWSIFCS